MKLIKGGDGDAEGTRTNQNPSCSAVFVRLSAPVRSKY